MAHPDEKPEPQNLEPPAPDEPPSAEAGQDTAVEQVAHETDETRLNAMQIALDVQAKELLHKADRVGFNVLRQRNPEWKPDLRDEDFSAEDLSGINMSGAKLQGANFESAILFSANFQNAELGAGTSFKHSDLRFADFFGTTGNNTDKNIFQKAQTEHAKLPNPILLDSIKILSTFREDFDKDPSIQSKISWEEVESRLLSNEGHYLFLARAMESGGELFGVDADGNPLISDRGDEPIMKGMNYKDTRDRVKFKYTSNNKKGTKILDAKKKPIATGYEMFGYVEPYEKSDAINQYEAHTGKHFVQTPDKGRWRSSWLESGDTPSSPRTITFDPRDKTCRSSYDYPHFEHGYRGVRRLLRVKKD